MLEFSLDVFVSLMLPVNESVGNSCVLYLTRAGARLMHVEAS